MKFKITAALFVCSFLFAHAQTALYYKSSLFPKERPIMFSEKTTVRVPSTKSGSLTGDTLVVAGIKDKKKNLLEYDLGKAKLSFNAYGDFGYVVGPQRTHTFYDYITKDTVTQFGRRDYTSYPMYANQFSLAYAYVQAQYEIENKLRIRMAFHTGHTVDALYAEETNSTKIIRELAVYYHFNEKWAVETGIFPSYFGAETVLSKNNLHATRAYIADFSPDYEAGFRLHYKHNPYNTFSAMVLNGWQVIRENNTTKAFALGWNVNKPGKIDGSWNFFFGNEQTLQVDYTLFRHYQNVYYRIWLSKKLMILPVLDFVLERRPPGASSGWNQVIAPAFSIRYGINEKIGVAARWDYIYDKANIIPELYTGTPNGWQSNSATLTFEYLPIPQITMRLEGRYGMNKDAVFRGRYNEATRVDWYGIASVAFSF